MHKKLISKSDLRKIVNESVNRVLNEFFAGENAWEATYSKYRRKNDTNANLDEVVADLHSICQYFDKICKILDDDTTYRERYKLIRKYFKSFEVCDLLSNSYNQRVLERYFEDLLNNVEPIYELMTSKTNRKGDAQAMTVEDICGLEDYVESLKDMHDSNPIDTAAGRVYGWIQEHKHDSEVNESHIENLYAELDDIYDCDGIDQVYDAIDTILSYYDEIFDCGFNREHSEDFPDASQDDLERAMEPMEQIQEMRWGRRLTHSRSTHPSLGMIASCKDAFDELAHIESLGPVQDAALKCVYFLLDNGIH